MAGPSNAFSEELHQMKYRNEGETFQQAMKRIADGLKDDEPHGKAFREILSDMRFLPGGRVQAAIGSQKNVTAYNCFVAPTLQDSFVEGSDSIMDVATYAAATMRMGGGIGYNFSTLRNRGAEVISQKTRSSGPVSFMHIFDSVCKTVASAGHRRGAQMAVLDVNHPDIEEFITAKQPGPEVQALWEMFERLPADTDPAERSRLFMALQNTLKLTAFNVSVGITDKFMHHLATGKPFPLTWEGKIVREVDPAELWDKIMRSTWDWAEPGVLFIDTINRKNNLWYAEKIAATNPCVPGYIPILTDKGYVEISTVVGQTVNVWNGEEFSPVVPYVTGYDQPLLKITLSDGAEIECTPGHRFYDKYGNKVEAKDLAEGSEFMRCAYPVVEGQNCSDTTDAYAQGFFSGDGWRDQRGRDYIGLWGDKKKVLHMFTSPVSVKEYAINGGYEGTDKTQTKLYVYMGKNRMKSKNFVPDCTYSLEYRLLWLAGIIDADACVVDGSAIQLSAKDRAFLYEVKLLLNTLGVTAQLSPMKECWRLSISPWDVVALKGLNLPLERLELTHTPNRHSPRPLTVISVEETGYADVVYCFTERKRAGGVFNGMYTSQCGEQPLPPNGACLLGSFNLVKYITKSKAFDFRQLRKDIAHVVRAMDNVIDRTTYPLPQQGREARSKRRMGLGVTGLANALEIMGYPYGTPEFLKAEDEILAFLNHHCYITSIELAKEKGSFALLNKDHHVAGEFIKSLDPEIAAGIKQHGIRNSHLTSIAPTGTISLCADNVSSGIEPVFSHGYTRTVQTFDGPVKVEVKDYAVDKYGVYGKTSNDVTIDEHVSVLLTAAKHVDSAVSKTCNVGDDVDFETFKSVYVRAYEGGAKGCTTFRLAGKRMGIFSAPAPASEKAEQPLACTYDPETGIKSCE